MNPFVDSACAAPTIVPARSQLRPRLRPWSRGGTPAAGGPPSAPAAPAPAPVPAPAPPVPASPTPPPTRAPLPVRFFHASVALGPGALATLDPTPLGGTPAGQVLGELVLGENVLGEQVLVEQVLGDQVLGKQVPGGQGLRVQATVVRAPSRRATAFVRRTRHLLFLAALSASGSAYGLDVNTATQAQLENVRGIGPKTATLIVKERQQRGRFSSLEDFSERVRGIGPKRVGRLSAQGLTVGTATRVNVGAPRSASAEGGRIPPALIVNTPDASKGKGH